jgi:C4-dicarboxylate-specific signal transduction histidine kinase
VLALPLGRLAVLYLGDSRRPGFTSEEVQQLRTLAFQGAVCLQCAEYFRRLQVSLTEYAQANQQLERSFKLLQDSQTQLVQAGKMAAVGQLAAGVAHELNSPLGAIVLGVEAAVDLIDGKPDRAKERLNSAWRSASRAQEIVAKLLFYSREGTQSQPFDLNQVVEDSLTLVSHQLSLDEVRVSRELGRLPLVEGNQSEIQQVIINLVLNARDAVLEPAARSRELKLATMAEGEQCCLVVSDGGPGVPAEIADRIFEPFFTTKPVGRGTGLGLSLSLQIVQQHGGQLTLEAGERTTFRLSLPVAQRPLAVVD